MKYTLEIEVDVCAIGCNPGPLEIAYEGNDATATNLYAFLDSKFPDKVRLWGDATRPALQLLRGRKLGGIP